MHSFFGGFIEICFSSIGVVFAFISNEKVNDSVQNFENTVNTALDTSLNFIDDTQLVGGCGVF